MTFEKLSKYLSQRGVGSRRKCDALIESGYVKVNNIVVLQPFIKIDSKNDSVTIDKHEINQNITPIYIALYKPIRYIADLSTDKKRNIARNLIPIDAYLFPIGRLDYNSEGLMIFTNDGDIANIIMHPRYGIEKEYLVKMKGVINDSLLEKTKEGFIIDGSLHRLFSIQFIKLSISNSWYRVTLKEGKNRIIRKISTKIGHPVLKLIRTRIGPIQLRDLKPGEYRYLADYEIKELLKLLKSNKN